MDWLRPIPGYSDYWVSKSGDIYSTINGRWHGERRKKLRRLSLGTNNTGYYFGFLRKDDGSLKKTAIFAHRAVMLAWNSTDNPDLEVNHINGIKTDNRLENLEWVTHSENARHFYDQLGKGHRCRLYEWQIQEIRFLRMSGWHLKDISARFGKSRDWSGMILRGEIMPRTIQ